MARKDDYTPPANDADAIPERKPQGDLSGDAGQAEVQATMDAEQEQGYRGTVPDETPNENYTVAGQGAGAHTPESLDAEADDGSKATDDSGGEG